MLSAAKPVRCRAQRVSRFGALVGGEDPAPVAVGPVLGQGDVPLVVDVPEDRASQTLGAVAAEVGGVDAPDALGGAAGPGEDVGPAPVGPGQDGVTRDVGEVRGLLGQLADGPVHRRPLELAVRLVGRGHADPHHLGPVAGQEVEVGVEVLAPVRPQPRVRAQRMLPQRVLGHALPDTDHDHDDLGVVLVELLTPQAPGRVLAGDARGGDEAGHGVTAVLQRGGDGQGDVGHQGVAGQEDPQGVVGRRPSPAGWWWSGRRGGGAGRRGRGGRCLGGGRVGHLAAVATGHRQEGDGEQRDGERRSRRQRPKRRMRSRIHNASTPSSHVIFLPSSRLRAL